MSFWTGLGSIGASLLGGLFGSSSQSSANRANAAATNATNSYNLKIARENNSTSRYIAEENNRISQEQFQQQMDYNRWAFNRQLEYNSAPEQVARLREAGLNPALFMSGAGQASGSSAPSGSSLHQPSLTTPQMVAPRVEANTAFQETMNSISSALLQLPALQQQTEDAKGKHIDNSLRYMRTMAEIESLKESTNNTKLRNIMQEIQNKFRTDIAPYEINIARLQGNQLEAQNMLTNLQMQGVELDNAIKLFNVQGMDQEFKLDMAMKGAQIQLLMSQNKLTRQEAVNAYQNSLKTAAETYGIKLSNGAAVRMSRYMTQRAAYQVEIDKWNAARGKEEFLNVRDYGTPYPTDYEESSYGGKIEGKGSGSVGVFGYEFGGSVDAHKNEKKYKKKH